MEITPMSSGTAVSISMQEPHQEAESLVQKDSEISQKVFSEPEFESENPIDAAEMLFKSAKEEGFEEALTHLAEGDFDSNDTSKEKEVLEDELEGEEKELNDKQEDVEEKEYDELQVKVEELESQVEHLIAKNEDLQNRLLRAEDRSNMSQKMLLEMIKYLYEMATKEDDEKQKLSFFEILLAFVAKFMMTVIEPDIKLEEESKKSPSAAEKNKSNPSLDEMIKFLEEKGMLGIGNVTQDKISKTESQVL